MSKKDLQNKNNDIETITKERFMQYLTKRKELNSEFGKVIVEKAKHKDEIYEKQKDKQRSKFKELYGNDDDFTEKIRERGRNSYHKRKERNAEQKANVVEPRQEHSEEEEQEEEQEKEVKEKEKEKVVRHIPRFNMKINNLF